MELSSKKESTLFMKELLGNLVVVAVVTVAAVVVPQERARVRLLRFRVRPKP